MMHVARRGIPWRCLFAILTIVTIVSAHAVAADRPNIVLIVIDDLGWADLGCYGSRFHKTPHLDQMAASGMRFTDSYAACPVCSPTRASIMTGKYPARLHLTDWLPGRGDQPSQKLLRPAIRQQLPLEETTLAEVLHAAGYATGIIGKWHLGGEGFQPQMQGFDHNIAGDHTGTPLSYFAPYARQGRFMPGLENAPEGEYLTDRLTAEAEKFIERNASRPFFLYLPHYTVHIPLKAPETLVAKYPAQPNRVGVQNNPVYAAMVDSMDASVGRVLKKLDELQLSENTLVLFTSDNGGLATSEGPNTPATINAPLREGKGYLYEGGVRTCLLARWPGKITPGTTCETPVSSIDYLPTILAACGVESPAGVDGVSLLPLLRQQGELARDALYWHYPHYSNQGGRPGGAVRSGDYKLIEFYEQGRRELFNLKLDLRESRNLAEEQPERVRELAAQLANWRTQVDAQMMRPNPQYVPNPQAANGQITLPARTADVHGVMLRYEPLPHKNTLGFWVRQQDFASWEFDVTKPGNFELQALIGCGKGSGGSEVEFGVSRLDSPELQAGPPLRLTVEETGGFQSFVMRTVGQVALDKPGRYKLTVTPKTKPGVAVMDLRQVALTPR